jgi:hypothetical protein
MMRKQIGTQTGVSIGGVSVNVGSPHINTTMNNHTDNNKKPINFFIMFLFCLHKDITKFSLYQIYFESFFLMIWTPSTL